MTTDRMTTDAPFTFWRDHLRAGHGWTSAQVNRLKDDYEAELRHRALRTEGVRHQANHSHGAVGIINPVERLNRAVALSTERDRDIAWREHLRVGHDWDDTLMSNLGAVGEAEKQHATLLTQGSNHLATHYHDTLQGMVMRPTATESSDPGQSPDSAPVSIGLRLTADWLCRLAAEIEQGDHTLDTIEEALAEWIQSQEFRRTLPEYRDPPQRSPQP